MNAHNEPAGSQHASDPHAQDEPPPTKPGRSSDQCCRVDLIDSTKRLSPQLTRWLAEHTHAALDHLALTGEIRVRIIADDEMATQHQAHTGVSGTTDVLTFDLNDGSAKSNAQLDTDVLICIDEAQRQAAARHHNPEHELLLYLIHAILHCIGYDDHNDDDYQRMHTREDEILTAIGVGTIFNTATDSQSGAAP